MPGSSPEGKAWATEQMLRLFRGRQYEPLEFLDIGAGAGNWLNALKPSFPSSVWVGVEVWEPYVERFRLLQRYHHLVIGDVRTMELPEADVIILGDVLEHMSEEESVTLYERAMIKARTAVIGSVPIIHYPQGAEEGNPHEVHVQEHLTVEKIKELFHPDEDKLTVGEVVATWITSS